MDKYVLGMDVGGTHTRLGLVALDCSLTDFEIVKTEELQKSEDTVGSFIRVIREYLQRHAAGKEISAVSAGFPSTLDRDRRTVLSTPNIRGFNNIAIVDRLEEEFGIPAFIETDVDMLLLYDMFEHQIPAEGITCGFYFGTGLGNAVVIDGRLLIGKTGAAAELGHIPVRGLHGACGCGNTSCIEMIASGYHLKDLCVEKFPGVEIGEVFAKCRDQEEIHGFIDDLALAAATEINILDPDHIVIGGGLVYMEGFPRHELEEDIYKYARKPYPARELQYIYSRQGQENGVIGAGILAYKRLEELRKEGR
ncbi:allose kinase [Lachnoclostridium sp. An131]|uniref:allose kinase n=1 Tax=Lachnoclostridium sp. An131 TaxID=1965555 RepID=UPI000B36C581|nr:allose kinase [Lachnoclostridium sp. An131]OUQ24605.1 allose kinase [Lachnoclostridium sp. An131]